MQFKLILVLACLFAPLNALVINPSVPSDLSISKRGFFVDNFVSLADSIRGITGTKSVDTQALKVVDTPIIPKQVTELSTAQDATITLRQNIEASEKRIKAFSSETQSEATASKLKIEQQKLATARQALAVNDREVVVLRWDDINLQNTRLLELYGKQREAKAAFYRNGVSSRQWDAYMVKDAEFENQIAAQLQVISELLRPFTTEKF